MTLDLQELEDAAKAGVLLEILGERPTTFREMLADALGRDHVLPGSTSIERAEETAYRLHRLIRAIERYGREVGSVTFDDATERLLDDWEGQIAGARMWSKRGLRRETFARPQTPFPRPTPGTRRVAR